MKTNDAKGRMFVLIMGAYLIIKVIINAFIGGLNVFDLIIAIVLALLMYVGVQFFNYVAAAVLVVIVLMYIKYNLTNMPGTLLYVIEGAADIFCAVMLCVNGSIKKHFTNSLTDLKRIFSK